MNEICMAVGATSPTHRFTLLNGSGEAVNIGEGTVTLRIKGLDNGYSAARAAVIEDAEGGVVDYLPISADTADPGLYAVDFLVTFDDGSAEVFPVAGPAWMEVRP